MRRFSSVALLVAVFLGQVFVAGCDSGDGDSESCPMKGKKTMQFQLVESASDEGCPALPDESVDFDAEDDDALAGCTGSANEDTCTAYLECVDDDVEMTLSFTVKDNAISGTAEFSVPVDDQGNYASCTYLMATK